VCSPLRNALAPKERRAQELAASPIGTAIGRLLAQIATLEIDGRTPT
jgi:hypothetical protein